MTLCGETIKILIIDEAGFSEIDYSALYPDVIYGDNESIYTYSEHKDDWEELVEILE